MCVTCLLWWTAQHPEYKNHPIIYPTIHQCAFCRIYIPVSICSTILCLIFLNIKPCINLNILLHLYSLLLNTAFLIRVKMCVCWTHWLCFTGCTDVLVKYYHVLFFSPLFLQHSEWKHQEHVKHFFLSSLILHLHRFALIYCLHIWKVKKQSELMRNVQVVLCILFCMSVFLSPCNKKRF